MDNKFVVVIAIGVVLVGVVCLLVYVANNAPKPESAPTPAATAETQPTSVSPEQATRDARDLYQQGLAAGQTDRARAIFEDVATRFPDTWAGMRSNLELGDIYMRLGEDQRAPDAFRKGKDAAAPENVDAVQAAITRLEKKVAQGTGAQNETEYIVRPGDTLSSIARGTNTKVELIKLAMNKLDNNIRPGETLHISAIYPDIVVDKKTFKLTLNWKKGVVRQFTVGIGKDNSTPVGEFVVESKIPNPDWYPSPGRKIPFGNPENILGTRWMGLKATSDHTGTGYGIHGTFQPETVGSSTSAGCVRMLNKDVEELFEWVPLGAKVVIK